MFSQDTVKEIVELLEGLDTTTKIYFGCDSVRTRKHGKWTANYATVMIIHINGKNGCRLFSTLSTEPDYDAKISRPRMRMMNEVRKVCEVYTQLIPYIENFAEYADVEFVVIDKNTDVSTFRKELRWNEIYYMLANGLK